jgi:hypothetical protein
MMKPEKEIDQKRLLGNCVRILREADVTLKLCDQETFFKPSACVVLA